MGGIEIYAVSIVFVLGMVGLIRGPSRELGVTMALIVLLAVFSQVDALDGGGELPGTLNRMLDGFGLGTDNVRSQNMVAWMVYFMVVILTTFLAYHGQDTLKFSWKAPSGIIGLVLGWLIGAFNGYLICGTLWYYMDKMDYPMQQYSWFRAEFSEMALTIIDVLPQNIASGLVMGALALALLWWRILK
jgi:uncharacterized membrane protein required for colicin V production